MQYLLLRADILQGICHELVYERQQHRTGRSRSQLELGVLERLTERDWLFNPSPLTPEYLFPS